MKLFILIQYCLIASLSQAQSLFFASQYNFFNPSYTQIDSGHFYNLNAASNHNKKEKYRNTYTAFSLQHSSKNSFISFNNMSTYTYHKIVYNNRNYSEFHLFNQYNSLAFGRKYLWANSNISLACALNYFHSIYETPRYGQKFREKPSINTDIGFTLTNKSQNISLGFRNVLSALERRNFNENDFQASQLNFRYQYQFFRQKRIKLISECNSLFIMRNNTQNIIKSFEKGSMGFLYLGFTAQSKYLSLGIYNDLITQNARYALGISVKKINISYNFEHSFDPINKITKTHLVSFNILQIGAN